MTGAWLGWKGGEMGLPFLPLVCFPPPLQKQSRCEREPNYLSVSSLQADFGIMLNECDMIDEDQAFFRNAGITTFAKMAFCVLTEEDLQKDILLPAGAILYQAY